MIEITDLHKGYGATEVLKGINLTIADGQIFGLVGVSGAGKSTLLRCINGLEDFQSGSLTVNGTDVGSLSERELRTFRSGIGMIFQHFSLLERKTVFENVAFPMRCFGIDKERRAARVNELLELVGLSEKAQARPRELSGGQKQRVAIARALTMEPSILLCDEATSALDPNITRSILDLLSRINRELGITIVVVTHAMSVVKAVCDGVAILDHGTLTYSGGVQELFLNHADVLRSVTGARDEGDVPQGKVGFRVVQRQGDAGVLARLAVATGVVFDVLEGGLDTYRDDLAGSYLIGVDERDAAAVEAYLEAQGALEWERLGVDAAAA